MEKVNVDGTVLWVHNSGDCLPPCPIHAPSDHRLKDRPRHWRSDRRIMERICEHGVGHPDPDDFMISTGSDPGFHGCDGCCEERTTP